MNSRDFEQVVAETIQNIQRLLVVKGGEYAGSEDRLANFKRGAERTGMTSMQCLSVYMHKHLDAIDTFVRNDAGDMVQELSEPIDGRIDDAINYLMLLKGLIRESGRYKPERRQRETIYPRIDLTPGMAMEAFDGSQVVIDPLNRPLPPGFGHGALINTDREFNPNSCYPVK